MSFPPAIVSDVWLPEVTLAAKERRLWIWKKGHQVGSNRWRYRRRYYVGDDVKFNTVSRIIDPGWRDAMVVIAWSDPNLMVSATHFEIMMAEKAAQAKRGK